MDRKGLADRSLTLGLPLEILRNRGTVNVTTSARPRIAIKTGGHTSFSKRQTNAKLAKHVAAIPSGRSKPFHLSITLFPDF
jgi:hypothetical protein